MPGPEECFESKQALNARFRESNRNISPIEKDYHTNLKECKNDILFIAYVAITLLGLFTATIMFVGLWIYGGIPYYVEQTEPQTHRTFVAEYQRNMMMRGSVKLYERFGPLLLACDVEEYVGDFSLERPEDRHIYISEDGKRIVVAYFFLEPIFIVPVE